MRRSLRTRRGIHPRSPRRCHRDSHPEVAPYTSAATRGHHIQPDHSPGRVSGPLKGISALLLRSLRATPPPGFPRGDDLAARLPLTPSDPTLTGRMLTTLQASLHAADRPVAPPKGAFDTGLRRRAS